MKETYGSGLEFPDDNGCFQITDYPDRTIFNTVEDSTPPLILSETSASSSQIPSTPRRRALAVVKVFRADLGNNGKPCNFHSHNLTVHVNIYNNNQACVTYIMEKVREEMQNETLKLVGTNGLVFYDQEGTQG